jgi:hypothetical protein
LLIIPHSPPYFKYNFALFYWTYSKATDVFRMVKPLFTEGGLLEKGRGTAFLPWEN